MAYHNIIFCSLLFFFHFFQALATNTEGKNEASKKHHRVCMHDAVVWKISLILKKAHLESGQKIQMSMGVFRHYLHSIFWSTFGTLDP